MERAKRSKRNVNSTIALNNYPDSIIALLGSIIKGRNNIIDNRKRLIK